MAASLPTAERILPPAVSANALDFAETETRQLTNDLDHVNLLGARFLDDHIEFGLALRQLQQRQRQQQQP